MAKSIYHLAGAPFPCTGYGRREKSSRGHGDLVSFMPLFFIIALLLGLSALIAAPCPAAEPGPHRLACAALQLRSEGTETIESAGPGCRVERKEFFSSACSSRMAYYAFVPSQDREGARYPVLYLLHGALADYTTWKEHAGNSICQLVAEYGMVIVTPEGRSFGWYADSRLVEKNQVETYFIKELIPDVEKNFPTNGLRGIAGLSMGGHGAFVLCLRNPGVFSSVSSMSGILDITRHPKQWHLAELFGPYVGAYASDWDAHSALRLIVRSESYVRSLPMLITVSQSDPYAIEDNRLVHAQLEKMHVHHSYDESPGGHDWTYWTKELPVHVSFHARYLSKPVEN